MRSDALTTSAPPHPCDASASAATTGTSGRLVRVRCRRHPIEPAATAPAAAGGDDAGESGPSGSVRWLPGSVAADMNGGAEPPPHNSGANSSSNSDTSDESDDDARPRRRRRIDHGSADGLGLTLEVEEESTVAQCGVQLWRGALLMTDWLLHCEHSPRITTAGAADSTSEAAVSDVRVPRLGVGLELGSGVGLGAIVLSRLCHTVFATDLPDDSILPLCARNVARNVPSRLSDAGLIHEPQDTVRVRALDWREAEHSALVACTRCQWPSRLGAAGTTDESKLKSKWELQEMDFAELCEVSVLIAADVLYDAAATVAFVKMLSLLLLGSTAEGSTGTSTTKADAASQVQVPQRWLWLTLERRIVFSMAEQRAHAPAVELFFELLEADGRFAATQIPTESIPQRCMEYERTEQLELWRIEPVAGWRPER